MTTSTKRLLVAALAVTLAAGSTSVAFAQQTEERFETTSSLDYLLYIPEAHDPDGEPVPRFLDADVRRSRRLGLAVESAPRRRFRNLSIAQSDASLRSHLRGVDRDVVGGIDDAEAVGPCLRQQRVGFEQGIDLPAPAPTIRLVLAGPVEERERSLL